MKDMLEKVIHEPVTYASHRQGLVTIMERVMQIAGINLRHVKFSSQGMGVRPYYTSHTAVLVVMPDLEMPEFVREMVTNSGVLLATAIQSVDR